MSNLVSDVNAVLHARIGLGPYASSRNDDSERDSLFEAGDRNTGLGDNSYNHDPFSDEADVECGADNDDLLCALEEERRAIALKQLQEMKMEDMYYSSCNHPFFSYYLDYGVAQHGSKTRSDTLSAVSGHSVVKGLVACGKHQQFYDGHRVR